MPDTGDKNKGESLKMNDNKVIIASIYGRQSEKMKRKIDRIREEIAGLTSDELKTLNIIFGLERMIKVDEETAEKVIKFPTVANLEAIEK